MKTTWTMNCAFGAALCLMVVTQAVGQAPQSGNQDNRLAQTTAGHQKVCLASKVQGMTIKDKANQECGQIQDLVIDEAGQVQYLAISSRDQAAGSEAASDRPQPRRVADQNAKLTLVPFEDVEFHEGEIQSQNYASLKSIDKDRLSQAPSFTRQQLASQTQQGQWMSQVDRFFDRESSGAARPDLNDRNKINPELPERKK